MRRGTHSKLRFLAGALLVLLILSPTITGFAQGKTVTGTGTISGEKLPFVPELTLTFPPLGGPVSGTIGGQQPFYNGGETCTQSFSGTADGTYKGGDGAPASGGLQITYQVVCSAGTNTQNYSGTWSGTFKADGTGSGEWTSAYGGGTWQVSYAAADFKAIASPPKLDFIYFQQTYGITVENGDIDWKDDELRLLDEALRELPPALIDKLAVRKIVRYEKAWNENWQLSSSGMGVYYNMNSPDRPMQVQVFDSARNETYYGDTSGDTKFKATIVHELIHGLQGSNLKGEGIKNLYANPLVNALKDFTQPAPDPRAPNGLYGWHYNIKGDGKWHFYAFSDYPDSPPGRPLTDGGMDYYAGTNPLEDMTVSAELYMFRPESLKAQSPKRYEFMRDKIFGGVEYENGIQK